MPPLVSVIIPTYNRADLLGEALESALGQSLADIEVIVVDDGSTDATPELLAAQRDPRVRALRQANQGTAAARNAGLRLAQGRYIACLDSDDRWDRGYLATTVAALEADPALGVAYVRCRTIDQRGRPLARMVGAPPRFRDDMLASLLYGDHLCAIGAVTRRSLLEQVGGWEPSLLNTEDWDLWLKLAPLTRFGFIDQVLASVRSHSGRITGRASPRLRRVLADRQRVLARAYQRPGLTPAALAVRPVAFRNLTVDIGLRTLEAFGWREGLRFLLHAVVSDRAPHAALARIASQLVARRLLSGTALGVRLIGGAAALRRRLAPGV